MSSIVDNQVEMPKSQPTFKAPFLGFTKTAEIWNSRACMIGLIGTFIVELVLNLSIFFLSLCIYDSKLMILYALIDSVFTRSWTKAYLRWLEWRLEKDLISPFEKTINFHCLDFFFFYWKYLWDMELKSLYTKSYLSIFTKIFVF